MFRLKLLLVFVMAIFLVSCSNIDYLNNNQVTSSINLSSNEVFNNLSSKLSLPSLKSLNEDELLELYAIDPKLLIDYISNIPNDNITGTEISIFRLKEKENVPEVILGIERRINELEKDFKSNINKQIHYDLIKNPYLKTFHNYVIFALHNDLDMLDKIFQDILK